MMSKHKHPANISRHDDRDSGQRIADGVARAIGSWRFIIIQSMILTSWIILNVVAYAHHWDPYPFILLNLALSFQAAYATPILLLSQNRQSEHDRVTAEHDYQVNQEALELLHAIAKDLNIPLPEKAAAKEE